MQENKSIIPLSHCCTAGDALRLVKGRLQREELRGTLQIIDYWLELFNCLSMLDLNDLMLCSHWGQLTVFFHLVQNIYHFLIIHVFWYSFGWFWYSFDLWESYRCALSLSHYLTKLKCMYFCKPQQRSLDWTDNEMNSSLCYNVIYGYLKANIPFYKHWFYRISQLLKSNFTPGW